jgi:hypothetical protein
MRRNCPLQNVKQTSGLSAFISWKFLGGRDFSKKSWLAMEYNTIRCVVIHCLSALLLKPGIVLYHSLDSIFLKRIHPNKSWTQPGKPTFKQRPMSALCGWGRVKYVANQLAINKYSQVDIHVLRLTSVKLGGN